MTENTPTGDDPVSPAAVAGPVVVIGGGTMGRGIALAAVAAGLDTTLVDSNRDALDDWFQGVSVVVGEE